MLDPAKRTARSSQNKMISSVDQSEHRVLVLILTATRELKRKIRHSLDPLVRPIFVSLIVFSIMFFLFFLVVFI